MKKIDQRTRKFSIILVIAFLAVGSGAYALNKKNEAEKSAVFNIPQMLKEVEESRESNVTPIVAKYISLGTDKNTIKKELEKNDFTVYVPQGLEKQKFEYDQVVGAQKILSEFTWFSPVEVNFVTFYFFENQKLITIKASIHLTGL